MFTYVDLFAGCGGLSLGVERAGGKLLLAVEKSDMAARTFYSNFVADATSDEVWRRYVDSPIESQVASRVAVSPLRSVLDNEAAMKKISASSVDAIVGGPPCQGFSLAGRRNPSDIRNRLPWEYLELVARTRPKVVVIENVVGMNRKFVDGEESPFVQLQQALREIDPGYVVQGVAVNALHYGAPQNRPRLMIIGVRSDVAMLRGLKTTEKLWHSNFLDEFDPIPDLAPRPAVRRADSPTVADAIGDLQSVRPEPRNQRSRQFHAVTRSRVDWGLRPSREGQTIPNQTPRKHAESTQIRFRIYQWLRENNIHPRALNAEPSSLSGLLAGGTFPAVAPDGMILAPGPTELAKLIEHHKTRKHSQKALAWNEPARTVVTLPDDYVHPSEPRIFTVREMARFQGFPDDFEFLGKETTGSTRRRFEVPQYSQVGNAVSPFLSLAVGKLIANIVEPSVSDEDSAGSE